MSETENPPNVARGNRKELVSQVQRKGGMPAYKFLGNRILTRIENLAAGTDLSEWHSGYRAYSVASDPANSRIVELVIRLVPNGICTTWVSR